MLARRTLLAAAMAVPALHAARAEVSALRIGAQFGIGYLPLYVVQKEGLLDAALHDLGLPPVPIQITNVTGGPEINDGLLSGNLDIGGGGSTALMIAADKSAKAGDRAMLGLAALSSVPYVLMSTKPDLTTLAGVSATTRIGVPAAKVSVPAVLLAMAADRQFHDAARFDATIVTLSQPDGAAALRSRSGIDGYAFAPPFTEQLEGAPGIHTVWSSTELFGEPVTALAAWTTRRFHQDNPKTCAALVAALREAVTRIKADPARAAAIYLEAEHSRLPPDLVLRSLARPDVTFGTQPTRLLEVAAFMARTGQLRAAPAAWTDLFYPEIHAAGGS